MARVADPQLEQALLERIRVLVLVDADPGLLRLDDAGGVQVRFEEVDCQGEHVLEVDPAGALLVALVAGVDAPEEVGRDGRPVLRGLLLPALGRDAAELLLGDPKPPVRALDTGPST